MADHHHNSCDHMHACGADEHTEHLGDPAAKSLADALRVSFRLLSIIMVGVAVAFLGTGIKSIEPYEVGILTRFGKVVGVAEPGLAYTWPYPIGDVERIRISDQRLGVDDFWMQETAEDLATRTLSERTIRSTGLKPGYDGALLTGDRNLLHTRLGITYVIRDPVQYRKTVGRGKDGQKVTNELIRSVICRAAIRSAAFRTADGLQRTEREGFASDVRMSAQDELDAIRSGIELSQVLLTDATWPLQALSAYMQAQNAVNEAQQTINRARAEAEKILNDSAGPAYRLLVGDPTVILTDVPADLSVNPETLERHYGLIGLYRIERLRAEQTGDNAKAEEILGQIDSVLLSGQTSGQASRIISDSRAYSTGTIERVKSRAQRFNELLVEYERSPRLMLERLWAQTRDDILESPTVEKFYITTGQEKTILRLNRDPDVVEQILRELSKQEKEKRDQIIRSAR